MVCSPILLAPQTQIYLLLKPFCAAIRIHEKPQTGETVEEKKLSFQASLLGFQLFPFCFRSDFHLVETSRADICDSFRLCGFDYTKHCRALLISMQSPY